MISVFIDTFIVLNMTVFAVLSTDALATGKGGIALTQAAFSTVFGGFGDIFVAICLLFFAFSTILSWQFFGAVNVKYLFGDFAVKIYSAVTHGILTEEQASNRTAATRGDIVDMTYATLQLMNEQHKKYGGK